MSIDGKITKLTIDEGYYSIGEIVDIIDSQLMDLNQDIILNITKDNNISIQG
mgnify:CR=1 FL=1